MATGAADRDGLIRPPAQRMAGGEAGAWPGRQQMHGRAGGCGKYDCAVHHHSDEACSPVPLEHLAASGLNGADPKALVFPSPEGGALRYSNFRARWLPARQAAGPKSLGFHDLRCCAATALVAAGVDVRTAQARLGHSDARLTLAVYAQVTGDGDSSSSRASDRLVRSRIPRGPARWTRDERPQRRMNASSSPVYQHLCPWR